MYLPADYDAGDRPCPLLLYLHGSAASGDDIETLFKYGLPALLRAGRQVPVAVLGPQCREGKQWDPTDLESLINSVICSFRIDPQQVFVTGYSMGGLGAWEFAAEHPQLVAAMVSVAGASPPGDGTELASVPIWAFHGDSDEIVNVGVTRESVEQIKKAGGHPKLTIYEGAGHGIESRTLGNDEVFEWMLSAANRRPSTK